jgi:hypothetical protein
VNDIREAVREPDTFTGARGAVFAVTERFAVRSMLKEIVGEVPS